MTRHCQGGSHVTSPPYPGAWLPISYRPCCPIFCATLHSTGLYWVGGCDRLLLPLYLALVSNHVQIFGFYGRIEWDFRCAKCIQQQRHSHYVEPSTLMH
ncbi:hypothetical protein GGP41_007077 [Bipolaris sorokiniana]|uniref:Uncharacterized protein n=1 Tax=Cochliobolus sativus TaxID=45130 RepID=A0A8H6E029_COCSA|nr:hypothetical protein GGP41_007077 [Bipolaris sorokiniana]